MNKVRVEVFYQDNALQSIRIDHYEMEGLVAIENKTIPEWFMPASGRASWKGLKEEPKQERGGALLYFQWPGRGKSNFSEVHSRKQTGQNG